jgi:hypothetical protein
MYFGSLGSDSTILQLPPPHQGSGKAKDDSESHPSPPCPNIENNSALHSFLHPFSKQVINNSKILSFLNFSNLSSAAAILLVDDQAGCGHNTGVGA